MKGSALFQGEIIIPHATSCGGYNFFYPSVSQSVSQSVSPVFLVSATPLKQLNRIFMKLYSYEGSHPFPRGDNYKIVKIH